MLQHNRRFLPAMVLGAMSVSGAIALAADTATEDLKAQVNALQAKVEALEAKQLSTKDVDDTVRRILTDADTRSHMLASEGFTAGYSKGKFLIQSADGNFVLQPMLQFQLRYDAAYRDDGKSTDAGHSGERDATDDGFELRRMKFGFGGNAISPDLTYLFVWATNRKANSAGEGAGVPVLEDAWARYKFAPEWTVQGGQYKDPWSHTNTVSTKRYLAVDASLLDHVLGDDQTGYIQGVSLGWQTDPLRAQVVFHDGASSGNTNFQDAKSDYGVTARGEWKILGDNWTQYEDFTALGNKNDLLVAGIGADWTSGDTANILYHSADIQWEPLAIAGLSMYGSFINRATNPTADGPSTYDWGFLAQAGYMLTSKWEVFGRYDMIRFDEKGLASSASIDTLHEITAGVNYYINGHAAKFTADLTFLPSGTGGASADGQGILPTSKTQTNAEWVARLQFQLLL